MSSRQIVYFVHLYDTVYNVVMRLICTIFLLFSISAHGVDFSQTDKQLHFLYGYTGSTVLSALIDKKVEDPLFSFFAGFFITQTIGVLKEVVIDSRFDGGDIEANLLGGLSSSILFFVIKF